jgi:rubrerythrin
MRSLFGALNTVVGAAVHVASGMWLCRTCGKVIEPNTSGAQCGVCKRKGRR